jgi:hypothetical protein
MTSTEARAREVLARHMASKHWGALIREGNDDNWGVIKPREAIAAMLAFAADAPPRWKGIESYLGHKAALVGAWNGYGVFVTGAAFLDATGVWRVLHSEGGMSEMPFEPTHWLPLPAAPTPEAAKEVG